MPMVSAASLPGPSTQFQPPRALLLFPSGSLAFLEALNVHSGEPSWDLSGFPPTMCGPMACVRLSPLTLALQMSSPFWGPSEPRLSATATHPPTLLHPKPYRTSSLRTCRIRWKPITTDWSFSAHFPGSQGPSRVLIPIPQRPYPSLPETGIIG